MKNIITPKRGILVALVFFVLMVLLGSVPGNRQVLDEVATAKVWHFGAYGFLSIAVFFSLKYRPVPRALFTLLVIALLGAMDEAIQSFLPYRAGKFEDWTFDVLTGAICVGALYAWMKLHEWLKQ